MINHNSLMYKLLDRTLTVKCNNVDYVANYTEGDLFELVAKLSQSNAKYPIIWLQSGYTVERRKQEGLTKMSGCRFFLITKGDKVDRYKKRFETTYEILLYPLLKEIDKKFMKTNGIEASENDSYTVFPLNDIARDEGGKKLPELTTIADVWDAVLFETDITINNDCFNEFKIK